MDPGFFLGEGVPLTNGVTDWRGKLILKVNIKFHLKGGVQPLHHPPRSAPDDLNMDLRMSLLGNATNHSTTGPLGYK